MEQKGTKGEFKKREEQENLVLVNQIKSAAGLYRSEIVEFGIINIPEHSLNQCHPLKMGRQDISPNT